MGASQQNASPAQIDRDQARAQVRGADLVAVRVAACIEVITVPIGGTPAEIVDTIIAATRTKR